MHRWTEFSLSGKIVSVILAFKILNGRHQWEFVWCLCPFFPEGIKEKLFYVSVSSSFRLLSQASPLFHGSELLSYLSQGPVDLQFRTLLEGLFAKRAVANLATPARKQNREKRIWASKHANIKI